MSWNKNAGYLDRQTRERTGEEREETVEHKDQTLTFCKKKNTDTMLVIFKISSEL